MERALSTPIRLATLALLTAGCGEGLACGPGTTEEDGLCVPAGEPTPTESSMPPDTGALSSEPPIETAPPDPTETGGGTGTPMADDTGGTGIPTVPPAGTGGAVTRETGQTGGTVPTGETGDTSGASTPVTTPAHTGDTGDPVLVDSGPWPVDTGLPLAPVHSLSLADAKFLGESSDDWLGYVLEAGCDLDGDGMDDLVIGGPNADRGGSRWGAAYVFFGTPSGSKSAAVADVIYEGQATFDAVGAGVECGDVDLDGDIELAVMSAGGGALGEGSLELRSTPLTPGVHQFASADVRISTSEFLSTFDLTGDMDGDGVGDLILGAEGHDLPAMDAGGAYILAGPFTGDIDVATAAIGFREGEGAYDEAGDAAIGAGDLDGDGLGDVAISAEGMSPGGAVYLEYGPVLGTESLAVADGKLESEAYDKLGRDLDGGGDINGDGTADLVVSGPTWWDEGTVYLVYDAVTGNVPIRDAAGGTVVGEQYDDSLGDSVRIVPDEDGDGFDDLLLGAHFAEGGPGASLGAVYLVHGPVYGELAAEHAALKIVGPTMNDAIGMATASGDLDGDGLTDYVFGSYFASPATGSAWVTLGASLP